MIKHIYNSLQRKNLNIKIFLLLHTVKTGNSTNRYKIRKRKVSYKFLRHWDHGTSFTVQYPWDQAKYEPSGAKATVQFSRPHFLSKGAARAKSSPIVRDLTKKKKYRISYITSNEFETPSILLWSNME